MLRDGTSALKPHAKVRGEARRLGASSRPAVGPQFRWPRGGATEGASGREAGCTVTTSTPHPAGPSHSSALCFPRKWRTPPLCRTTIFTPPPLPPPHTLASVSRAGGAVARGVGDARVTWDTCLCRGAPEVCVYRSLGVHTPLLSARLASTFMEPRPTPPPTPPGDVPRTTCTQLFLVSVCVCVRFAPPH